MSIPTLYLMMGIPGSGKSYHANMIANDHSAVIHASDAIRDELFDGEYSRETNAKVFSVLHRRVKKDLRRGQSVIYDATNISFSSRKRVLLDVKSIPCRKVLVFIATPLDDCLAQNSARERKVPGDVIERMYEALENPKTSEGFDEIWVK